METREASFWGAIPQKEDPPHIGEPFPHSDSHMEVECPPCHPRSHLRPEVADVQFLRP